MAHETLSGSPPFRVTLFFGPQPVEGAPDVQACVFNVKKRSWKAGIQVSVEISDHQLARLRQEMRLAEWVSAVMTKLAPEERLAAQARVGDLFVQAMARCKLDLRLAAGLSQENQRIPAIDLVPELERSALDRWEYVAGYILSELDLAPDCPPPFS